MKRDAILIFFISWVFFLVGINHPAAHNFDEFHYIPSAFQWLNLIPNQNWEHPPLAKLLIVPGLVLFGDTPLGWRFMSTLFGALTMAGFYVMATFFFDSETSKNHTTRRMAWVATILAITNQFVFVQARIAMLDTFMMAFLIWSLAFLIKALDRNTYKPTWIQYSGMLIGLAIACKWFALIPWALGLGLQFIRAIQLKSKGRLSDIIFFWCILPAFYYFASFTPYLLIQKTPAHTFSELLTSMQMAMWDGQKRVVTPHPYASQLWDWITLRRPMWYAFNKEGLHSEYVRGVLLLGNPIIMWGGLWAVLIASYDWVKNKSWSAFLVLSLYLSFTLCWLVIPRKIAFYYYYYPAAMALTLACAYVLQKANRSIQWVTLTATTVVFIWFYPILSALKIPAEKFRQWMILDSWI